MTMSAALDAARRMGWAHLGESNGHRTGLRGLLGRGGLLRTLERRHGYIPKVFVWQGCLYDVRAVERCRTVRGFCLQRTPKRRCFQVRARARLAGSRADTTFEICQDMGGGSWLVERRLD